VRLKPQPLPTPKHCPVCRWGKRDPHSLAAHNLACSQTGERSYTGGKVVCAS
jgi:ribosomal protein L33